MDVVVLSFVSFNNCDDDTGETGNCLISNNNWLFLFSVTQIESKRDHDEVKLAITTAMLIAFVKDELKMKIESKAVLEFRIYVIE